MYLSEVVERIVEDKRVTVDEMAELHQAIEKVLPRDARKAVVENRKVVERAAIQRKRKFAAARREAEWQAEKAQKEKERERRRQEWQNRPRGFHFKVCGVTQRNDGGTYRQTIIRDTVRPRVTLIYKREPDNTFDEFAISLWVKSKTLGIFETEHQIGYVNSFVAGDLASYLDSGGWARFTVQDVTGGGDKGYGVNIFIEDGRDSL